MFRSSGNESRSPVLSSALRCKRRKCTLTRENWNSAAFLNHFEQSLRDQYLLFERDGGHVRKV